MTEQDPKENTRTSPEAQAERRSVASRGSGGPADDAGAADRGDILERIVETKRAEVRGLDGREPELHRAVDRAPPPRDFRAALAARGRVGVIAEVKRRSPGAGAIAPELDPIDRAAAYERGGASALSVLTDGPWFQGSLDDLAAVRERTALPVLRKDFVIDERQIWEARAAGADAVLLIVRILDDERLAAFGALADELGMAALVEAHDGDEVERALASGAEILGINNRDLRTFETRLDVTLGLLDRVPADTVLVSESGISSRAQVARLGARGVDAVLVGEALVRAADPEGAVRALAGVSAAGRRPSGSGRREGGADRAPGAGRVPEADGGG